MQLLIKSFKDKGKCLKGLGSWVGASPKDKHQLGETLIN